MTRVAYVISLMAKAWSLTSPIAGATPKPVADAISIASTEKPLFAGADGWRQTASLMVLTQEQIAARFSVTRETVSGIKSGRRWGWVE